MNELLLGVLGAEAREYAPRLFALFGFHGHHDCPGEEDSFLAWGMECADVGKAILWFPGGATWHADSAARLLDDHNRIGTARLVWLDEPHGSTKDDYDLAGG